MIVKSLSRKSNAAQLVQYLLLRYTLKEKDTPKDREHATVILRHNLRARSLSGFVKEFKENESYRIYRRKDSVVLFHNIISLHPGDKQKISEAILKDIAAKFVSLRASNCLALGVAHRDKEHAHIHVVTSGVQVNGYSARVSKQQFKSIIQTLETYQREKYPELIHSKNNHRSIEAKTKEEMLVSIKAARQTTKLSLIEQLEKIYNESYSYSEFLTSINEKNYEVYYRNDTPTGLVVEGKKFRFSRLGFDDEKLQRLEAKEKQEVQQLAELQSIRERTTKEKVKYQIKATSKQSEIAPITHCEELEQLQTIRARMQIKDQELETTERNRQLNVDAIPSIAAENYGVQPSLFDIDTPEFELHNDEECI